MTNPPLAGSGLHQWILEASRHLILQGYDPITVHAALLKVTKGKGREEQHLCGEIYDAIRGAVEWMKQQGITPGQHQWTALPASEGSEFWYDDRLDSKDSRPQYMPLDQPWQEEVLARFSKVTLQGMWLRGKFNYRELFDLNWNLCFALDVSHPVVKPLNDWRSLDRMQFTVPSPLLCCGIGGQFKNDSNMCRRTYQVIEFDQVESYVDQFRLLVYLGTAFLGWSLAMVVYSGGKSLHGWFPCYHKDHIEIRSFFLEATRIGADSMLRIPSQYVRVPGGWNYRTKRRQEVLHWDLELIREHNNLIRKDVM